MSNSLLPLRPSLHKTHGFSQPKDFSFTKDNPISVVLIDEMASLITAYPLGFAKIDKSTFVLVSLQGLYKDENLFINEDSKWIVNLIPNIYKSHPFVLVENTLCFNMQSELYTEVPNEERGDVRFFDDNGNIQEVVEKVLKFLSKTNKYKQLTTNAVEAIAKANLLSPWILSDENKNPDKPLIQGLYRINEQKLKALNGEQLEILSKSNALSMVYAQLLSMPRVHVLEQLHETKTKKQVEAQDKEINLDEFFGESANDTISFGF